MGTATHSLAKPGVNDRTAPGVLIASGAHTTSTTASNLTDGAAGAGSVITAKRGQKLTIQVDEAARVQFGGVAATATSGHIVFAGETTVLEVSGDGTISVADLA